MQVEPKRRCASIYASCHLLNLQLKTQPEQARDVVDFVHLRVRVLRIRRDPATTVVSYPVSLKRRSSHTSQLAQYILADVVSARVAERTKS